MRVFKRDPRPKIATHRLNIDGNAAKSQALDLGLEEARGAEERMKRVVFRESPSEIIKECGLILFLCGVISETGFSKFAEREEIVEVKIQ